MPWLLVYFVVVALMVSLLTAQKLMPPLLLLAFTFAFGVGNARQGALPRPRTAPCGTQGAGSGN